MCGEGEPGPPSFRALPVRSSLPVHHETPLQRLQNGPGIVFVSIFLFFSFVPRNQLSLVRAQKPHGHGGNVLTKMPPNSQTGHQSSSTIGSIQHLVNIFRTSLASSLDHGLRPSEQQNQVHCRAFFAKSYSRLHFHRFYTPRLRHKHKVKHWHTLKPRFDYSAWKSNATTTKTTKAIKTTSTSACRNRTQHHNNRNNNFYPQH